MNPSIKFLPFYYLTLLMFMNFAIDENCDTTATADFRSGQSLSAGNASASSEETHFLQDLQLLIFPPDLLGF
ncbi:hypothetical protein [Oceanobacillus massiliensis]|uniref:hypothetical protein n=1 Tax=Oceanobacillus massiliensis TaxID=1465765 RepID=UPI0012B5A556|nr:hypothetical protein [Oceanobacillus massiliensis]